MIRVWLFTAVLSLAVRGNGAAEKRPNILFAFADDWGRYASAYEKADGTDGINGVVSTPHFDRIASEGVLFRHAFVTAPSCTPCRSSILSGQYFFRTGRGAILQGAQWDMAIPSFPMMLKSSGYHIGEMYKVWSPGSPVDAQFGMGENSYQKAGGRINAFSQNVTKMMADGRTFQDASAEIFGEVEKNFVNFLEARESGQPFCHWFGPTLVHRKWVRGSGKKLWGIDPDRLKGKLPPFLPDVPEVREDFADYLGEVQAFDAAFGVILSALESAGELENTLIVVSGDHGAPGFPRGKCNLYDFGVAVPLAIRWGGMPGGRVMNDFVNLMDLAPTFLEAGGVDIPGVMTGRSLVGLLKSEANHWYDRGHDWVITGRERHVARARDGNLPYPQRALRTPEFLYIINFKPDRWPMGDPRGVTGNQLPDWNQLENNTFITFGDLDASPTKAWMISNRSNPDHAENYQLGFGKRPEFELYDLMSDPHQIRNVADDAGFAAVRDRLHDRLIGQLEELGDPRVIGDGELFENPPFAGD